MVRLLAFVSDLPRFLCFLFRTWSGFRSSLCLYSLQDGLGHIYHRVYYDMLDDIIRPNAVDLFARYLGVYFTRLTL